MPQELTKTTANQWLAKLQGMGPVIGLVLLCVVGTLLNSNFATLDNITNEIMGGPMLLRVPAASLRDLASYGEKMQALGYPYYAIGTRIAFDPNEAFPKFVFSAIRPLSDAEADVVLATRGERQVATILAEGSEAVQAPVQAAPPESVFEQPPASTPVQRVIERKLAEQAPVTPQVTPQATPRVAAPPPPLVAAAPDAPAMNADFEASLDAALDGLLADPA
mgnify:CR=1 FL=1